MLLQLESFGVEHPVHQVQVGFVRVKFGHMLGKSRQRRHVATLPRRTPNVRLLLFDQVGKHPVKCLFRKQSPCTVFEKVKAFPFGDSQFKCPKHVLGEQVGMDVSYPLDGVADKSLAFQFFDTFG